MKLDAAFIPKAEALFSQASKVVITNHVNPDGDAMGSAMGLAGVLRKKGFDVSVIVPNSFAHFLRWMKGVDTVVFYEQDQKRAVSLLEQSDLLIHLDYNTLARSGEMRNILAEYKGKQIIIDHHQQPEDFADLTLCDPGMSSTCELVYHFLSGLKWLDALDKELAECLYTGIITDTGNFRYSSTSPLTHQVASHLLEKGVQPNVVASEVYDNNSHNRFRLLSRALYNMEVLDEYKTTIITLSNRDLQECRYQKGDSEGIVNYGLAVFGIMISVFMVEEEGRVKISFRSKGTFDVNRLARRHFRGGGHTNAAGGISYEGLRETIKRLKDILPLYKEELETYNL